MLSFPEPDRVSELPALMPLGPTQSSAPTAVPAMILALVTHAVQRDILAVPARTVS